LAKLELARRADYREARREVDQMVAETEAAYNLVVEAWGRTKDASIKDDVAAARKRMAVARKEAKSNPDLKERVAELNRKASDELRRERSVSGLYWGTYGMVEAAAEAARKETSDPQIREWDGGGRVGVQIQNNITTDMIQTGRCQFVRIDGLPESSWDTRSARRHAFTVVRIRVGTVPGGIQPVWVEFPMLMHRPLPPGRVTWAWIKVSRIGFRRTYTLQITVESDSFTAAAQDIGRSGHVDMSLCWLPNSDESIRVGSLSDGQTFDVPSRIVAKFAHTKTLRSICDRSFNDARLGLIEFMDSHDMVVCPMWLPKEAENARHWNRHGKLRYIAQRWAAEVFGRDASELWREYRDSRKVAGLELYGSWTSIDIPLQEFCAKRHISRPEDVFALKLAWWLEQDTHLTQWECDQRIKTIRWRRQVYREWAKHTASRYATISIDTVNLADVARQEDEGNSIRFMVAPSELRVAMTAAFGKDRVIDRTAAVLEVV